MPGPQVPRALSSHPENIQRCQSAHNSLNPEGKKADPTSCQFLTELFLWCHLPCPSSFEVKKLCCALWSVLRTGL